jgi:hypothetical protein
MKFVAAAVLGLSLAAAAPAFAAAAPAIQNAASSPAHVQAVQALLAAMQVEKAMRGVVARSRYPSEAQRKAVSAKFEKTPPAEIYRRLAPQLAPVISADTAVEMARFYNSPYGKRVIHDRYNGSSQIMMPGMTAAVAPEEKKERKRAAYVQASKELAAAQPMIEREAFKLLQRIDKEQR